MLVLLRIIFASALCYMILQVRENAALHPDTGDLANAGYLAICVMLAIANAVVWAPFLGAKVSDPLTGSMTSGAPLDEKNRILQLIRWCERRHYRRLTLLACFLEGIRRPWMPTAFVIGLNNSKPGTWWEKIYAREVYRFNNIQNCLLAYKALRRHGIRPDAHPNPEIDLALLALERPPRPEAEIVPVPPAPQSLPLQRNPRIRLFDSETPTSESAGDAQARPAMETPEAPAGSAAIPQSRAPDST